jgi:hypothetical protein
MSPVARDGADCGRLGPDQKITATKKGSVGLLSKARLNTFGFVAAVRPATARLDDPVVER